MPRAFKFEMMKTKPVGGVNARAVWRYIIYYIENEPVLDWLYDSSTVAYEDMIVNYFDELSPALRIREDSVMVAAIQGYLESSMRV